MGVAAQANDGGVFRWQLDSAGRRTRALVDLDDETLTEAWLVAVEAAQSA
jgi:hypothetical protein